MLEFNDVLVTPYTELLDTPRGLAYHRGGPIWPDWDRQVMARHCQAGDPVDSRPEAPTDSAEVVSGPVWWGGAIFPHFGHQVADFSMRLLPTLSFDRAARIAFSSLPRSAIRSLESAPEFFREILEWFGIADDKVLIISRPTLVERLLVAPQAEQLDRGPRPEIGPGDDHLDALDELVESRLGHLEREGCVYVSRAGQHARFAGEAFLEQALRRVDVRVVRPEAEPLVNQLHHYATADRLLFAEGSAVHATKLLGRNLGNVGVFVRRPTARFAERSLAPRARTVSYLDATIGPVLPCHLSGKPAHDRALTVLSEDKLFAALSTFGIEVSDGWDSDAFGSARDDDIMSWLRAEIQSPRGAVPETRDSILSSMMSSGLGHLADEAAAYMDEAMPIRARQLASAAARPPGAAAVAPWSARRINRLVKHLGARSYLEIGVDHAQTLLAVDAVRRVGVGSSIGPELAAIATASLELVRATPETFFGSLAVGEVFEVVFLTGAHGFDQVYRDLCSALTFASPRTVVLIDDTWPVDKYSALPDRAQAIAARAAATGSDDRSWHGDVYKVVLALHDLHPELSYRTIVDSGNAQTLVWRSNEWVREPRFESLDQISSLTYEEFRENRELLRPMSEEDAFRACLDDLGTPEDLT